MEATSVSISRWVDKEDLCVCVCACMCVYVGINVWTAKRLYIYIMEYSVQFSPSVMSDSLWPHGLQHARPPCPSPIPGVNSNSCPSNRWCHKPSHPLSSPSPPTFNLSQHQGLFQWVSSSHQVAKVLEFQLQHQPFQWIFRTDFLLLAVQGTHKSLLQHHGSKASILLRSAFFIVQLSHP